MRKVSVLLSVSLVLSLFSSCEKEECKQCIEVVDSVFVESVTIKFCDGEYEVPTLEALSKLEQTFKDQVLPVKRFQKCN